MFRPLLHRSVLTTNDWTFKQGGPDVTVKSRWNMVVRTIRDLMKGPPFTKARKAIAVSVFQRMLRSQCIDLAT